MTKCTHDLADQDTACVDGLCPLCLHVMVERQAEALDLAIGYLKEWQEYYAKMGKHQAYDFRDKLEEIDRALRGR